jgi:hypothetical protein
VNFSTSGNFSYATSFPEPILMGAAFDDELITAVATVIRVGISCGKFIDCLDHFTDSTAVRYMPFCRRADSRLCGSTLPDCILLSPGPHDSMRNEMLTLAVP